MNAYNQLINFAQHNTLKLWTKDLIPELGNYVIVTDLNLISTKFYNHGVDEITDDIIKYSNFIIGDKNIYFIEWFNIGKKVHLYGNDSEISKFLIQNLHFRKDSCGIIETDIDKWIICWNMIYKLLLNNLDSKFEDLIFKTELFNDNLNNPNGIKLYDSGLKRIYLKLKYPNQNSYFTIELFFDLNELTNSNYYYNLNLSVEYAEGDNPNEYKFYYSNKFTQNNTYPSTPENFIKLFEQQICQYTIIDTLFYFDNRLEMPINLDVLSNY